MLLKELNLLLFFFELYNKSASMTDFDLDLVEIEKISPIHQESIRKTGKIVYERR